MALLQGKTGLVIGVANDHSIGWGIAQALHREGANLALTYRRSGRERRVAPLAERIESRLVAQCDVCDDTQVAALMDQIRSVYGSLDMLIYGPAAALPDDLHGPYIDTSRAGFLHAVESSVYSLNTVIRAALDRALLNPGASVLALTYHGARQVVEHYNVMGVAKAALEASVRYLASDLGPHAIRVNAISPGPIRTLSASGISGFRSKHRHFAALAPLGRTASIDDVGQAAVWLCSEWASAVTGEVIYVDAGLHHCSAGPAPSLPA